MAAPAVDDLLLRIRSGDQRQLSRSIRRLEDDPGGSANLLDGAWSDRARAKILGVTGPPGAGKSTVVNEIITAFRQLGHRVAVLAVDPSSPWTGGAILGDRVRMQEHAGDEGVFIRSLASRGALGGLSRATLDAAVLCAAAGFDRIVIETVGVGQTELDVVGVADQVLVLLVPEAGDVIQALKAGLLEGADLFAVNKADRGGADALVRELRFVCEERASPTVEPVPIFTISALSGAGVAAFLVEVLRRLGEPRPNRDWRLARDQAIRIGVAVRVGELQAQWLEQLGEEGELGLALAAGRLSPYAVARRLLETR